MCKAGRRYGSAVCMLCVCVRGSISGSSGAVHFALEPDEGWKTWIAENIVTKPPREREGPIAAPAARANPHQSPLPPSTC